MTHSRIMLSIGDATPRRSGTATGTGSDVDEYRLSERHDADGSATLQLLGSIVVPGAPMVRRAPIAATVLLAVGFVLPVGLAISIFVKRDRIISIALDGNFLLTVAVLGPLAVLVRFVAVAEVAEVFRGTRLITLKVTVATSVVAAMGIASVWFAGVGLEARAAIAGVFGDGDDTPVSAVALAPAEPGDESSDVFRRTEVTTTTERRAEVVGADQRANAAQSLVSPDEVRTVLVMGVDSGPGREGRRTDTMLLVTVHPASGRTALISIPRNLTQLQFPDDTPLGERFPTGFSDLANGVFTAVSNDPGLVDAYGFAGFPAEPIALSSGVAQSLDVQIDDFVLIDMLGFADVIDAVGGVTVELCQTVALPPSLPGEPPVPPEIGPGEIDMDGVTALAYARTRYADSDYERTGRQRQLLAALSSQISLVEALRAFTAVARVLDESLRTSLTVGEFDDLLQALGDNSSIVESVGLVPPLIQPSDPDYDEIRSIVADVHRAIVTGEPSGYTTDAGPEDPSDRTTDADGNCLNEGIG